MSRTIRGALEKRGKNFAGRSIVWLVMFFSIAVIFWDAVPTWVNHRHLCETESGVKVYMTADEWKKKYPDRYLAITSLPKHEKEEVSKSEKHTKEKRPINSDFEMVYDDTRKYKFGVNRRKHSLIDRKTGEVLYEHIEFAGGVSGGSIATGANSLNDYKFWLKTNVCSSAYPSLRTRDEDALKIAGEIFEEISSWGEK